MAEKENKKSLSSATDVAKIHPMADDKDVCYQQNNNAVRTESEDERFKRIAEMFLARPGNKEDRRERVEEIKRKDKKLSERNYKTMTKNKKKKKAEKKKKATNDATKIESINATKPTKTFPDIETEDDVVKREKHPGCFGFIRAWFVKRNEKKSLNEMRVNFSDILIEISASPRANVADNFTGNGLNEGVLESEDVEAIDY